MKDKILVLIIGILIGAIIATTGFLIYNKMSVNNATQQEMIQPNGSGQMREPPSNGNMGEPPAKPDGDNGQQPPARPEDSNNNSNS